MIPKNKPIRSEKWLQAVREFCAGYPRSEAERLAKLETAQWLKAHRPADEVQP